MSPNDLALRTNSKPVMGRGKDWGLSAAQMAELHTRAKHMRNNPTEPEKRLWRHLSNGQLNGFKFRRQEVIGWFIVDFACPSASLILEVDGDTHDDPAKDQRRDLALEKFGYRVLHVTNEDVMRNTEGVLVLISEALHKSAKPYPIAARHPSPEGEGLKVASLEGSVG